MTRKLPLGEAGPTRRQLLCGMGSTPLVALFGCNSDDAAPPLGESSSAGSETTDGEGSTSTSSTTAPTDESSDGSGSGDGSSTGEDCAMVEGWATGGTAAMCGTYPDPFDDDEAEACQLLCSTTLGPCYAETLIRRDISEGNLGLPVRLAFRVLDETCAPVVGAEVDIWHCSPGGIYSGEDAPETCTFGDEAATAGQWFRGIQTTDQDGRVDFDTCFPGWYPGRTIHVHLTVRVGGQEFVTSQLAFDDGLCADIVATQPLYSDRGPRDTTNTSDNLFAPVEDLTPYLFETERMTDGALLAWKTLVIRSSTDAELCSVSGGGAS